MMERRRRKMRRSPRMTRAEKKVPVVLRWREWLRFRAGAVSGLIELVKG